MESTEKSPDGADENHDKALVKLENKESSLSNSSEETLLEPGIGVHVSQLDKDGSVSSMTPRALQTPHTGSSVVRTSKEVKTPVMREKGFEDGYHWRKYGQKLVKGNEFVRSYYKCTHPSCPVKKQLERSHGGQIADVVYFGEHVHPKPVNNVPMVVGFVVSVEERPDEHLPVVTKDKTDKAAKEGKGISQAELTSNSQVSTVKLSDNTTHVLEESNKLREHIDNDEDQRSKRQKKSNRNSDPASAEKLTGESRFVVRTMSEVNIVSDGYRWRKYGQKMVKGNPNPRSYYRCSTPGCPAKKHVEKASHDEKLIITSYEGRHDHDMPPSRTVTPNATGTVLDAKSGAKSERCEVHDNSTPKREPVPMNNDSNPEGSKKTLKSEPIQTKSKGSEKAVHPISASESKLKEQENGKSSDAEENADAAIVTVAISGSVSNGKPSEKHKSEEKVEPEDEGDSDVEKIAHHHIPESEPVNS